VVNNLIFSHINSFLHLELQKLAFTGKLFSRVLDRMNTRWLRLSAKVAEGAMAQARLRDAARVFCGHTHAALYRKQDGIEYYNAGCWTEATPTYISIGPEGVRIHEFTGQRSEDSDSGEERGEADTSPAELRGEPALFEDAEYENISS
jgi:UDP-2,3-diacylglucosamine pyrophosphatase LpxH